MTAIGKNSTVGGYWSDSISDSTVIGGAHISASDAAAIGSNATVNGQYGVALGYNSNVSYASTGVGSGTKASNTGTAVGYGAQSSGYQSAAVGAGSNATGQNAVALGGGGAWGNYSIALGSGAGTTAHAIALGQNSGAWGTNAIAIGEGSNAWRANSIVLGKNSKSGADKNIEGYDPRTGVASVDDTSIWQSTDEAVSIGRAEERDGDGKITATAITRQLNNLAAGTLDTDAVNVAQLKAATQKVNVHDYSVWSPNTETDTNYTNGGAVAKNSLAAGVSAKATGDSAVAIGDGAQAEGKGATVIGKNAKATGQYATAFGGLETTDKKTGKLVNIVNTASGNSATAFGQGAQARGDASLAFGHNTIAGGDDGSGQQSVAFGEDTQALGGRSLAFGEKTIAKYNDSVAFGNDTRASSTGATAFGNRTRALAQYSTAWGNATVAADEESTAWGTDTIAGAKLDENGAVTNKYTENDTNKTEQMDVHGNLAYTYTSAADNKVHTAGIKQMPIDSGGEKHDYVVLAGKDGNTYVRDYQGSLWKVNVDANGNVTVDTSKESKDKVYNGQKKTSLAKTTVNGSEVDITPDNVLIKAHEGSNGYNIDGYANATAFGYSTEASGDNATAFGKDTKATAAGATAFGYKTLASGENSTAFGENSIAAAKNSLAALGGTVDETATNAAAIGSGAQTKLADSIALGSGSIANRQSGAKGYDMLTKGDTTNTSAAWVSNANAIAVGNGSTLTRQITGVAAGSQDTDAVNVAQLKAAGFKVTTQKNGAISSSILNGDTLDFEGENNAIVSTSKDSKTITVAVSKTPTFDSATFYNPNPTAGQNNEKVTIANGQISAFNSSEQKRAVIGVDNEGNGNLSLVNNDLSTVQVYTQNSQDKGNDDITRMYYVSSSGNGGEVKGIHTIAVLDDGINYVGDNYTDDKKTNKVVVKHKLNSTMDVTGGADTSNLSDNNIGVVATPAVEDDKGNVTQRGKLEIKLNKNLNLTDKGSVQMGNTTINNGGVTITPTGVTDDNKKISLTDKGLSNGGKQITHVDSGLKDAAGNPVDLATASGDVLNNAVNVGDLKKVSSAHTTVTVNGSVEAPDAGADGKLGNYTDKEKGNLLLAQKKDTTTGKITYDLKLNDNVILGKDTSDGKDGQEGTIGLTGKDGVPGTDGKQGYSTTIIKTEKGQKGADGKTSKENLGGTDITRIVYTDKDGSNPQTVATLSDGLKFAGDDISETVDKKLNETLQIRGDGTYDTTTQKTKEDGNIQVSADTDTGTIKVALNKDINLKQNGSLTVGGDTQDGSTTVQDPIIIKHFDAGKLTVTGTDKNGNTPQSKPGDYVTGLDNKDWDVTNPTYVSGRAATEDQLKTISDTIKSNAETAAGQHTAVTVNDKDNETTAPVGTDGKYSSNYGSYSDSSKGNLLIAAKTKDGQTTYNIKLNDQLAIGQKGEQGVAGKDGQDGKVTVETSKGTTVVIGHDGEPGKDGKDGISVKGQDGKDGVTISVTNGKDGKDGSEGHIGLTGPKGPKGADGKDGQNASADIHVVNGHVGVDGTDGNKGTNGMDRVVYEDHNHITHEVATMDDGQKYAGDVQDSNATANAFSRKLNEQTNVVGGVTNLDDLSTGNNVGVVSNGTDTLTIRLAKKLTDLTSVTTVKTDDKGNKTSETVQDGNGITITPSTLGDGKSAVSLTDKGLSNGGNQITHVDSGLKDAAGNKVELKDATGDVLNNAVNVGDLKNVQNAVTSAHTAVTVNGGVGAPDAGANGAFGDYTKEDKGNLLLAQKKDTNTNQITYDLKLNDKVALGKAGTNGKDGVDGSIGLTGADGKSSVGLNGKDGISVIGKDGKNGVSITGSNGKNGIDGKIVIGTPGKDAVSISGKDGVGHIGLTGPKGEKGADGTPGKDGISIDITTDLKSATLDDKKNVSTTIKDAASGKETTIEQAPRIQYKNGNNTYEVATMDDGLKFAGDFGKGASVKLNKTVNVKGNAKKETDLTDGNIGVVSSQSDDDGQLLIKLNKDLNLGNNGSVKMGNTTINNDGMTISKTESGKTTTVTLTDKGLDNGGNKITNVADGEISATSKEAVNGSQLNDVKTLAEQHTTVEAGPSGNVTVTPGTNADGSKKYTVDLAKDVTFGDAAKGDKTVAISGTNGTVTAGTGDDKVTVDGSKGQIVAGGDNGVKIGKIADGDGSLTIYDKDGKATGKTDKAGKYVTNLDNKTWNKDGSYVSGRVATEDQLHQVESNVNKQIADVNTKIDTVDKHHTEVTVNGGTAAKADGSYTDGNLQIAQKTGADGQKVYDLKLNDNLNIGGVGKDGKDGKDGHVGINGKDGKSGVGIDGKDGISVKGKDGQNGVTIKGVDGKDGTEGHIGLVGPKGPKGADGKDVQKASADIHVKNGQVGVDGTDGHGGKDGMDRVVYEDHNGTSHEVATMDDGMKYSGDSGSAAVKLNNNVQLYGGAKEYSAGDNIGVVVSQDGDNAKMQVKLAKDLKGIDSIDAKTVTTGNTTINNGGMTVKGDDKHKDITVQQGSVNMGGNKIEGVAPGKVAPDSTDAVNGSQLAQRDQAIGKLGGEVSSLDRRVDRVGAGAAALAALHPQDFDPDDKWDFAVGYGNYRGANAAAVGAFYRPNEDTTLSVGGTVGGGENMVNAGISFKFGQGNHVTNSRVAMAKEILALKDYVQKQDEKIEKLEALVGKQGSAAAPKRRSILFPDVPENHWAYAYVKKLADRGLLEGYPDGEFKGDRTITRYEFAAIFSRALENGASVDNDMERMSEEFEPEIRELSLNRFRVDRVEGKDNDRHKIERVRVNDRDELVKQKNGEQKKRYRDVYGSVIEKDAPADAAK